MRRPIVSLLSFIFIAAIFSPLGCKHPTQSPPAPTPSASPVHGGKKKAAHHGGAKSKPGEVGEARPTYPAFPWPPPPASATEVIPDAVLQSSGAISTLGTVDEKLVSALDKNGYSEKSYFVVPDGFALVTRLEQIEPDGTPKPPPARWSYGDKVVPFSLSQYLRALFTADPGYYRLIVFIVTDQPFSQSGARVTYGEASKWLTAGLNVLPEDIGRQQYSSSFNCTALIYEFEKEKGKDPVESQPSKLDARQHLITAGIWKVLGGGE